MSETGVSLLDPSTGLVDDQDVTIKALRAVIGKNEQKPDEQWPSLTMTFTLENGKEAHEYYSAGKLERLRPSPDGLRLLPNTEGAKLSDQTNAWKLIKSILDAIRGADDKKAAEEFMTKMNAAPDLLSNFDGMKVHVNRALKPKREEDGPDAKQKSIVIVSKIVAFPGKTAAKAGAKAAAPKAASAPAAAAAPAAAGGGAVNQDVVKRLLLTALNAKKEIPRAKVPTEVFNLAKAEGLDWKAAMGIANDEAFIKGLTEEPQEVDGNAFIVEYDGTSLKAA